MYYRPSAILLYVSFIPQNNTFTFTPTIIPLFCLNWVNVYNLYQLQTRNWIQPLWNKNLCFRCSVVVVIAYKTIWLVGKTVYVFSKDRRHLKCLDPWVLLLPWLVLPLSICSQWFYWLYFQRGHRSQLHIDYRPWLLLLLVLVLALSIFNHHLWWLLSRISAHLENILLLFKKIPSASSRPILFGQFVTYYFLGGRMCDIQCTNEQTVTATMSKHITETLCRCKLALFVNSNRSGNKTQLTRTNKMSKSGSTGVLRPHD